MKYKFQSPQEVISFFTSIYTKDVFKQNGWIICIKKNVLGLRRLGLVDYLSKRGCQILWT